MRLNGNVDFGAQVSRLTPLILREVAKTQVTLLAKGRLGLSHIVILELLQEKLECRMSELAETLHLTMSAATSIVDKMIELNLVKRERSKEDRRVVLVSLLKKGKDIAQEITKGRKKMANKIFSALTRDEKEEYLRLLRKVYESLRKTQ